jgi:hypothetical protein
MASSKRCMLTILNSWSPQEGFFYRQGETVRPDSYSDDIRLECAPGIHFCLTREEAEEQ